MAGAPVEVQRRWLLHRLMRIYHISHAEALTIPAHFADWALHFDQVEREADAVSQNREMQRMWGGG